jgi:hypothetical protein
MDGRQGTRILGQYLHASTARSLDKRVCQPILESGHLGGAGHLGIMHQHWRVESSLREHHRDVGEMCANGIQIRLVGRHLDRDVDSAAVGVHEEVVGRLLLVEAHGAGSASIDVSVVLSSLCAGRGCAGDRQRSN